MFILFLKLFFSSKVRVLQGYVEVKSGLFSFWTKYWVSFTGSLLEYFKTNTESIPLKQIKLAEIVDVEISELEPNLALQLKMWNSSSSNIHLKLPKTEERDIWMKEIQAILTENQINLISTFGLDTNSEIISTRNPNVMELNLDDLKHGRQKILYFTLFSYFGKNLH